MLALLAAAATLPAADLGIADGRCRPHEPGPAIAIEVAGLKDRVGTLRAELYPATQADFLADDKALVAAGKTFRRVIEPLPPTGEVSVCIRVPAPGSYALSLVHDRVGHRKFDFSRDGVGFPGNPVLGLGAPKAAAASIAAGPGITRTRIVLNYRRGLFSFGPLP